MQFCKHIFPIIGTGAWVIRTVKLSGQECSSTWHIFSRNSHNNLFRFEPSVTGSIGTTLLWMCLPFEAWRGTLTSMEKRRWLCRCGYCMPGDSCPGSSPPSVGENMLGFSPQD